jgi:hypothetical protein
MVVCPRPEEPLRGEDGGGDVKSVGGWVRTLGACEN